MPRRVMKAKKGRKAPVRVQNPRQDVIVYSGPITQVGTQQLMSRLITGVTPVTAGPSGILTFKIDNDPTTYADWAPMALQYSEYRFLGTRFTYVPNFTGYSTMSTPSGASVMVVGLSRDSTMAVPANVQNALSVVPHKFGPTGSRYSLEFRMNSTYEASWKNAGAVGANCCFFINADTLSPSQVYGACVIETLVQFRNPK
jgi:hypothetical protein